MKNTNIIGKKWKVVRGHYVYRAFVSEKSRWSTQISMAEYDQKSDAIKHAKELNLKTKG